MGKKKKQKVCWNKENLAKEAKKYKSKMEFKNGSSGAYTMALRKGFFKDITKHFICGKRLNKYWTKERCAEEAKKYKTKKEFRKGSGGAWSSANREKWMDDICKHMEPCGNMLNRYIYAIEFSDKSVYVGLSFDPELRLDQHLRRNKKIKKKLEDNDLYLVVFDGLYGLKEARVEEELTLSYYKDLGWEVLNVAKAGALGGGRVKWTKPKLRALCDKYTSFTKFRKENLMAYRALHWRGWLDEFCSHMKKDAKPHGYWTMETVFDAAKKCKTLAEFKKRFKGAFGASQRLGIYYEATAHFKHNN